MREKVKDKVKDSGRRKSLGRWLEKKSRTVTGEKSNNGDQRENRRQWPKKKSKTMAKEKARDRGQRRERGKIEYVVANV